MSVPLQSSDFAAFIDETFGLVVEGVEAPLAAELIEATEMGSPSTPDAPRRPFALQFRLPPGTSLGQGLAQLRHQGFPELAVFLVPVGEDDRGYYMEACFN